MNINTHTRMVCCLINTNKFLLINRDISIIMTRLLSFPNNFCQLFFFLSVDFSFFFSSCYHLVRRQIQELRKRDRSRRCLIANVTHIDDLTQGITENAELLKRDPNLVRRAVRDMVRRRATLCIERDGKHVEGYLVY